MGLPGVSILGPIDPRYAEILTKDALAFIAMLHRGFDVRRRRLFAESDAAGEGEPPSITPAPRIDRHTEMATAADTAVVDLRDPDGQRWAERIEDCVRLKDRSAAAGQPNGLMRPAIVILRPRGWRLAEEHLVIDGQPVAAALFDIGLSTFHVAAVVRSGNLALHLQLPDGEVSGAAQLWHDVLLFIEQALALDPGAIKTVAMPGLP